MIASAERSEPTVSKVFGAARACSTTVSTAEGGMPPPNPPGPPGPPASFLTNPM